MIVIATCKQEPTEDGMEMEPLTEDMVNNVSLDQGVRVDSINLDGGRIWKYAISVPRINSDEKVPLVLALHWASGREVYEEYLRCLAVPGFSELNAIIFAPDEGGYYFWESNNSSLILTLIEHAKTYWPIDPNKIIVTGYSRGGTASWFFGIRFPEIFSAAIPIASESNYGKILDIPFYVIHGEHDDVFPLEGIQTTVTRLKDLGSDIQLHVINDFSHYSPCLYSSQLSNAVDWLKNEVW